MISAVQTAHWSEVLRTASDRAVSQEATRSRRVRKFGDHDTPSFSLDQAYDKCLEALREAAEEASRPNWDGYGAHPVSDATLAQALAFLDLLPSTLLKLLEISPHPDGELAFEWFMGPRQVLTVSVNESGRLSYAALFGEARLHGSEFLLDALPETVALALRRLYSAQ